VLGLRRTAVWKGDVNFQGTMADKMDNAFKNAVSDRAARRFFRECGYGPLM